jgi:hypothetical protein
MTRRGRAVRAGVAVAVVYLALAAISGGLDPFARRPLLDGFGTPTPYRWVSPPPHLTTKNKRPASASVKLDVDPQTGSEAQVVTTSDLQVSLALGPGAFPPRPGGPSVRITIVPQAPSGAQTLPRGTSIFGNLYVLKARYSPSGPDVSRLRSPGQLTLFYPSAPDNLLHKHVVLQSNDGRTWRALATDDFQAAQQASASVDLLGYYAVGQSTTGTKKPPATGRLIYYLLLGGLLSVGVVVLVLGEIRLRRGRRARSSKSSARRPPRR